jgi:hypothetical protein
VTIPFLSPAFQRKFKFFKGMKTLNCAQAKQIDLVGYLAYLGYHPIRISGTDHWFHSPFRRERTASFKINRKMNVFYDHGTGQGGNIIDFGILYHRVTVQGFLQILTEVFKMQPQDYDHYLHHSDTRKMDTHQNSPAILVDKVRELQDSRLLDYLQKRAIKLSVAKEFCKEIIFCLKGKKHTAIGFRNNKGGYELRNHYYKGSSSPKTYTFIDTGKSLVTAFEGFFNFLSYLTIEDDNPFAETNFLVLNSLSFFERAREQLESHAQINLQLDRDDAGTSCATAALKSNSKYYDQSGIYEGYKDLNEWLMDFRKRTTGEL